jgi:hypothetical protein
MSSKYKVHPSVTSPSTSSRKTSGSGGSSHTPRRRPSVNHASNKSNNNYEETENVDAAETAPSTMRTLGRSNSFSGRESRPPAEKLHRQRSFNTPGHSASIDNENDNVEDFDTISSSKFQRTLKEVQNNSVGPVSALLKPPLSRTSSFGGGASRSRRNSMDDDLSVSSINSTSKPKPSLRHNGPVRRGSVGPRKKKVQFRTPLADYYEHQGEYFGDFDDDDSSDRIISFIPRRLQKRRNYNGEGVNCQCGCGIM